jgi:hypothetical protein
MKLIAEHQDYINSLQRSMDKERLELSSKHQSQIDDHKSLISKLTDEKNIAERSLQDLTKDHETKVQSAIALKDAAIETIKKQYLAREKDFEQKIASLSDILGTHKNEITKLESDKSIEKESAVRDAMVFIWGYGS